MEKSGWVNKWHWISQLKQKKKKSLTVEVTTQNYLQDDSVLTVALTNPEQEATTLWEEDASQIPNAFCFITVRKWFSIIPEPLTPPLNPGLSPAL